MLYTNLFTFFTLSLLINCKKDNLAVEGVHCNSGYNNNIHSTQIKILNLQMISKIQTVKLKLIIYSIFNVDSDLLYIFMII